MDPRRLSRELRKLAKTRGLKMTIDQDFAECMAECSHSVIEALDMCAFTHREMIPVYRCGLRLLPRGDLALCKLMGALVCMDMDPWAGPEGVDMTDWIEP